MLFSRSGVVMTKMMSSTNARSRSGVMLISLNVTRALRCEKRRMVVLQVLLFLKVLGFHLGHQFLGEVVELDSHDAQVMDQPVVGEHRGDSDQEAGNGGQEGGGDA